MVSARWGESDNGPGVLSQSLGDGPGIFLEDDAGDSNYEPSGVSRAASFIVNRVSDPVFHVTVSVSVSGRPP